MKCEKFENLSEWELCCIRQQLKSKSNKSIKSLTLKYTRWRVYVFLNFIVTQQKRTVESKHIASNAIIAGKLITSHYTYVNNHRMINCVNLKISKGLHY